MPTFDIDRDDLLGLLGPNAPRDGEALGRLLAGWKAELKGGEGKTLRVEATDTNRPDLWCVEGLARAARRAPREYPCFAPSRSTPQSSALRADTALREVRPYVQAFRAVGRALSEPALAALIQTQEKLAEHFGHARRTVSIGVYRAEGISFPIDYAAADPQEERMRALGDDRDRTFAEILRTHPKGRAYGHLLPPRGPVPILRDAAGRILSFPPIINSNDLGHVRAGDADLLVEATGTDLEAVLLTLNILAANLTDRGFRIEPAWTEYPFDTPRGRLVRAPDPWGVGRNAEIDVPLATFERILGTPPPAEEIVDALQRAGCRGRFEGASGIFRMSLPPYRADAMHGVDLVEEYMLVHGVGSFPALGLERFTVGRAAPEANVEDRLRDRLLGMGLEEIFSNVLCDRAALRDRLCRGGPEPMTIANPMSERFSVLRDALIPCLLGVESASGDARYPHRLFEVGEIVRPSEAAPHGCRTILSAAVLLAAPAAPFTDLASLLAQLLRWLEIPYALAPSDEGAFLPGRHARILRDSLLLGSIGEIHPEVLAQWGIRMPCAAFELDLTAIFGLERPDA